MAVARAVGVSPSTVSNAFNRPERLSPALRERVLRAAAELGYGGPDPVARSLRSGRAGAIGVVFRRRLADAFDEPADRASSSEACPTSPTRRQLGAGPRARAAGRSIRRSGRRSATPPWMA